MSQYTVPNGYHAFPILYFLSVVKKQAVFSEITPWVRRPGRTFVKDVPVILTSDGNPSVQIPFTHPIKIENKSDIVFRADASAICEVYGVMELLLIENKFVDRAISGGGLHL